MITSPSDTILIVLILGLIAFLAEMDVRRHVSTKHKEQENE